MEKLFSEAELDGEFEHSNFSDAEIVNGKSSSRQDSSNLDASDAGRGGIRRNTPQQPADSTTSVWRVENGEFVQDSCAVVQQPDKRKSASGRRDSKKSAHDHRRRSRTVISNGIVLENSTVFTFAGLQICVLPSSSGADENGQANKRFWVAEVKLFVKQFNCATSAYNFFLRQILKFVNLNLRTSAVMHIEKSYETFHICKTRVKTGIQISPAIR